MNDLLNILIADSHYGQLASELAREKTSRAGGLWGASGAFLLAALAQSASTHILLVTSSTEEAEDIISDINLIDEGLASFFPAWEALPTEDEPPNLDIMVERFSLLREVIAASRSSSRSQIVVATMQALLQHVPDPQILTENSRVLTVGQSISMDEMLEWLTDMGFTRVSRVEVPTELAVKGGILDVYPVIGENPFRIEFFGDNIESIRPFDHETQKSLDVVEECELVAIGKQHVTAGVEGEGCVSLLDYLGSSCMVVLKEPEKVEERGESYVQSADPGAGLFRLGELQEKIAAHTTLLISAMPFADGTGAINFNVHSVDRFGRELQSVIDGLKEMESRETRTMVFCNNEAEEERLWEMLEDSGLRRDSRLESRIGRLSQGFEMADLGVALLAHHEIFHRYRQRRKPRKFKHTRPIDSFIDLESGDYVVHASHGIGRFLGMELVEKEGRKQEFLLLEYENKTKLYVPVTKIGLVQKYIGGKDRRPILSKIGGAIWEKKKEAVKRAVEDLARELLEIQARRDTVRGIQYPADAQWQREFEAAFIYEETEDQLDVTEQIREDMQSSRPMDRLICGDVGFGKTEMAIRAAFRAVSFGKQVAVLVPTTILAQQHYRTLSERMADYPVNIEVLSRFRTKKEQRDIVEKAKNEEVDIVIGTHRLLQKDVEFKDLGLIIIDEEQRFGVAHKERLKKLRETVDVLTMTATPIPRTLHMSLVGVRDLSSLGSPPQDRLAIETHIMRFDPEMIRGGIMRELNRGGQVFFVHNRVHNIHKIGTFLEELVPEARIAIAHGQMPEHQLEERMLQFIEGSIDILLCTTIIESGLDIPNANSIFINNADQFGLSELHQLRGRVGRYKHRAHAYMILPMTRATSDAGERRLKAVEEFTELGAGFKIAMRDLEIRGAGNILGREQHGHIAAVGYDMYCQLLDIAVKRMRIEDMFLTDEVDIDINLGGYIPDEYIPDYKQKMEIYRTISQAGTLEELGVLQQNLRDRFGEPPREVSNVISENGLKLAAQQLEISSLCHTGRTIEVRYKNRLKLETAFEKSRKQLRFVDEGLAHLILPKRNMSAEEVVALLEKNLRHRS